MEERCIAYVLAPGMTPPEIAVMGVRIAAANRLRRLGTPGQRWTDDDFALYPSCGNRRNRTASGW